MDLFWWEAVYDDGSSISSPPHKYADIERWRLKNFRVKDAEGVVVALDRPEGAQGGYFVYRKRAELAVGGAQRVWFIVGWVGHVVVAYEHGTGKWVSHERFIDGHPILYPPVPHPQEGEAFSLEEII